MALDVLGRIKIRLLRQIADLDAFGGPGLTLIILVVTGNDLHQGGLARTVDADDGDLWARQELQVYIGENRLVRARERLGQTLHAKAIKSEEHTSKLNQ